MELFGRRRGYFGRRLAGETALGSVDRKDDRGPVAVIKPGEVPEAQRFEVLVRHSGSQCPTLVYTGAAGAGVGFADGNHYPFPQLRFDASPIDPDQRQRHAGDPGKGPGGVTHGGEPAGTGFRGGSCFVAH